MPEIEHKMWYDDLFSKYPSVFKNLQYFECDEGWYNLIDKLCSVMENYIKHQLPDDIQDEVYAVQIKEKFGGLRFYISHSDPFLDGAIAMAERMSYTICESCGAPVDKKNPAPLKRIIKTLCKSCNSKIK